MVCCGHLNQLELLPKIQCITLQKGSKKKAQRCKLTMWIYATYITVSRPITQHVTYKVS